MPSEPNLASLSKASDMAVSLVRGLGKNLGLVFALGMTALGILSWFEIPDTRYLIALTATALFSWVYCLAALWGSYRPFRQQRHFLKRLGEDEKMVLRPFLKQDRRTMHMNAFFAPTASLIAKGILSNATSVFPAIGAAIVIQSYSYSYLCEHPELLDMAPEEIGKSEIDDSDCPWMSRP